LHDFSLATFGETTAGLKNERRDSTTNTAPGKQKIQLLVVSRQTLVGFVRNAGLL
jgi:hypothetical protein